MRTSVKTSRITPYCSCEFPSCMVKVDITKNVTCRCGEENWHSKEWTWHRDEGTDAEIVEGDITFHPIYSQGTAIVRGNRNLAANKIHYWEMRVITPLAGTDVMIGIGTDKVNLDEYNFFFTSVLGVNEHSWGFSYNGRIQHNGLHTPYGIKFSQGCIVGVFLDRPAGRLEFFLNRRSLGIAFTNIPNSPDVKIYPMVASTTAKSVLRLLNSSSREDCLQFRTFQKVATQSKHFDELLHMPGLRHMLRNYWFLTPIVPYTRLSHIQNFDLGDEAILLRTSRKHKTEGQDDDVFDDSSSTTPASTHESDNENDSESIMAYLDELLSIYYQEY